MFRREQGCTLKIKNIEIRLHFKNINKEKSQLFDIFIAITHKKKLNIDVNHFFVYFKGIVEE